MCKVLSFVLELHVETLITEPISMDFGFRSVIKVNLLNLFGIYPAEQCRNLASLVRLPSEPRIVARPEGDSVPSVLTARHIEVRSWPLSLASSVMPTGFWPIRRPDGQSEFGSGLGLFPHSFGSYAFMGGEQ